MTSHGWTKHLDGQQNHNMSKDQPARRVKISQGEEGRQNPQASTRQVPQAFQQIEPATDSKQKNILGTLSQAEVARRKPRYREKDEMDWHQTPHSKSATKPPKRLQPNHGGG